MAIPNLEQMNEGYDIELFIDSKDANRYLCVICRCVFNKPYNIGCNNEHVFCKGCLDNYFIPINATKSCPSCRSEGLLKRNIKPTLYLDRLVKSLRVKCPFQIEQNEHNHQCVWSGELSDLHQHINIRCPLRNIICDYCNHNMKQYQSTEHQDNECLMKILSCEECKEDILRIDMEQHLLTFCAEREIVCNFQQYGCNFRGKQTLMDNHLKENEVKHLKMKVNIIENELKNIKQYKTDNNTDILHNKYTAKTQKKQIPLSSIFGNNCTMPPEQLPNRKLIFENISCGNYVFDIGFYVKSYYTLSSDSPNTLLISITQRPASQTNHNNSQANKRRKLNNSQSQLYTNSICTNGYSLFNTNDNINTNNIQVSFTIKIAISTTDSLPLIKRYTCKFGENNDNDSDVSLHNWFDRDYDSDCECYPQTNGLIIESFDGLTDRLNKYISNLGADNIDKIPKKQCIYVWCEIQILR